MQLVVADGLEFFEPQVPTLHLPLAVLLEHQRTNEPHDCGVVWEDADDVRAPLISALTRSSGFVDAIRVR